MESEVHQRLGNEKIQEICDHYLLEDGGKEIVDKFFGRINLSDLVKNKDSILKSLKSIGQNTNNPEEEKIEKIRRVVRDISELFIFTEQLKQKISAIPERRLECLNV